MTKFHFGKYKRLFLHAILLLHFFLCRFMLNLGMDYPNHHHLLFASCGRGGRAFSLCDRHTPKNSNRVGYVQLQSLVKVKLFNYICKKTWAKLSIPLANFKIAPLQREE
jgi:hypothetical protein